MPSKVETRVEIFSKLAIPVILGFATYKLNDSISQRSAATEYVQVAIGILADSKQAPEMRSWAVQVLDKYSAVPFGQDLGAELVTGDKTIGTVVVEGELSSKAFEAFEEAQRRESQAPPSN